MECFSRYARGMQDIHGKTTHCLLLAVLFLSVSAFRSRTSPEGMVPFCFPEWQLEMCMLLKRA
jgi:hypothetical protein